MLQSEPLLVVPREAAKLLSISERTLFGLEKAGKIPSVRMGRSVRYSPEVLREWIAGKCASAKRVGQLNGENSLPAAEGD